MFLKTNTPMHPSANPMYLGIVIRFLKLLCCNPRKKIKVDFLNYKKKEDGSKMNT